MTSRPITIRLGHSPDADDVFMWWPLFDRDGRAPAVAVQGLRFESVHGDIESLNRRAHSGDLEVTAISIANYPAVRGMYAFTSSGSSLGDGYGPKVIARRPIDQAELRNGSIRIAIPGERTSAFLTLCLFMGTRSFPYEVVDFERIMPAVAEGHFEAGLIIHEGQITHASSGLVSVLDLGEWWRGQTGLPLPLGGNVIRRDLDDLHRPGTINRIVTGLEHSVRYALEHREEGIRHALEFGRGLDRTTIDRYLDMYVNHWSVDLGEAGRRAISEFLGRANRAGLIADPGEIDVRSPQ